MDLLKNWVKSSSKGDIETLWADDKFIVEWLEKEQDLVQKNTKQIRKSFLLQQVINIAKEDPTAAMEGITQILSMLTPDQKQLLSGQLKSS